MLIVRAPFRVSLCGGGSDLPSFYEKYGGCVISAGIQKYMYICMHPCFDREEIVLKYSKTETVLDPDKIEHRIYRQAFKDSGIKGVELTSMADIPSGSGLGSSSSFTVALTKLLHTYKGEYISTHDCAQEACNIEINELQNPIGKQDQFAAAYGGLKYYEFCQDGSVKVEPIVMSKESYAKLENNLYLFYVGGSHDANVILADQNKNLSSSEDKVNATKRLVEFTKELKTELEKNNVDAVGEYLKKSWDIKRSLANGISSSHIDKYYNLGIKGGAAGGKLLGAGGGGFLLFYVDSKHIDFVRKELKDLRELEFKIDYTGVSIIYGQ